jgi:hypothetical protein
VDRAQRRQDPGALAEAEFCLARLYLKTREIPKAEAAYAEAARLGLAGHRPGLAVAFEELGRHLEAALKEPEPDG